MNTINTVATMLSEKLKDNSLIDIYLTDSGSLRTFAKGLAAAQGNGLAIRRTPKDVYDTFTEFSNAVTDEQYSDVVAAFTRLSNAFYTRLSRSYTELGKIKDTVSELVSKTSTLAKSRIAEDPVLAATESDASSTTKLKTVRWDLMQNISERAAMHRFFSKFDIKEDTSNEQYIQSLIISKLPYENERNRVELPEVSMTADQAKAYVDAIAARCKGIPKDAVKACVYHVFSIDEYKCRKAVAALKRLSSGEDADRINEMISLVYNYSQILPLMNRGVTDVAASTQEAISKRVDAMESFIDATTYLCSYYRNEVWKDAIVVPGMKINTDNWREFCSAESKMIKSNPQLAIIQYKNKIYGQNNIPMAGISGKSIVASCDQIAKEAYAEASANTLACNQKKREIFREAFIQVAADYLRGRKHYSVEYMYTKEPERFAAAIYDSNYDDAVENMFYTAILNSCYVDTLTAKLYNRLRDEYKKITMTAESVTERDKINADTKVLADVVSEFMVDLVLV